MSDGVNKVILVGNLGADPELKHLQNGSAVLKLRLATSETYLDKDKNKQERTEWHSITVWGKRGEGLAKFLSKGSRIYVEGSIRTSSYEKDGEKRYKTEIVASNIVFCGGKGGDSSSAGRGSASSKPTQQQLAPPPADDYSGFAGDDDIPF